MATIQEWPRTNIGKYTIIVADTPERKQKGLQFVEALPENHLLMFTDVAPGQYFHTVNCGFPLDIISLNKDLYIVDSWTVGTNIKLIGPTSNKTTSVIEVPAGWARRNKLIIGSHLLGALLDSKARPT